MAGTGKVDSVPQHGVQILEPAHRHVRSLPERDVPGECVRKRGLNPRSWEKNKENTKNGEPSRAVMGCFSIKPATRSGRPGHLENWERYNPDYSRFPAFAMAKCGQARVKWIRF